MQLVVRLRCRSAGTCKSASFWIFTGPQERHPSRGPYAYKEGVNMVRNVGDTCDIQLWPLKSCRKQNVDAECHEKTGNGGTLDFAISLRRAFPHDNDEAQSQHLP